MMGARLKDFPRSRRNRPKFVSFAGEKPVRFPGNPRLAGSNFTSPRAG